jgi:FtsP/CotA-like multicopper oxidase with cupredoxin domain
MQTMTPTSRLDDPGIGLRDNGRRVLTYADLRSVFDDPDGRDPGRTIELHLTGHMERFAWSFNGIKFADAEPIRLTKRSYRVTADALGRWAYHCHLLFHMESGMFREVRVDE